MATYNNPHWLLSLIRNSFISTDDTGLCETVMISDDLPEQFLQKLNSNKKCEKSNKNSSVITPNLTNSNDITISSTPVLKYEEDLFCYPDLDQSDDEDLDLASQSFDIPMYPEIGAHRYRSNTAQKLEKMEIARRKQAHIKNIKIDDSMIHNQNNDSDELDKLFVKKILNNTNKHSDYDNNHHSEENRNDIVKEKFPQQQEQGLQWQQQQQQQSLVRNDNSPQKNVCSKLVEQLLSYPKKPQNRFIQYAKFDGTSQTGIATKNLNIFLSMLPENQRNYPMKICVAATAKIQEVIGFICYKCNILNPEIQLESVKHYGLYISEDNGEMDMDFPPLDLREPCSKFGFTCLTLAELRPTAHITRVDYRSLSMTSEVEAAGEAAIADVQGINSNNQSDDMAKMLGHNLMIEAPLYRTFRLYIIIKGFFKVEVQLGISGEKLEIDPVQQKNSKFWSRQKAISYNIESIAYSEIIDQKSNKAILRIWYLTLQPPGTFINCATGGGSSGNNNGSGSGFNVVGLGIANFFPDSLSYHHIKSNNIQPDVFITSSVSPRHTNYSVNYHNFKYYDFETDILTAQQIVDKLNFILEVRSSVIRREFLVARDKKKDKGTSKKLMIK